MVRLRPIREHPRSPISPAGKLCPSLPAPCEARLGRESKADQRDREGTPDRRRPEACQIEGIQRRRSPQNRVREDYPRTQQDRWTGCSGQNKVREENFIGEASHTPRKAVQCGHVMGKVIHFQPKAVQCGHVMSEASHIQRNSVQCGHVIGKASHIQRKSIHCGNVIDEASNVQRKEVQCGNFIDEASHV